GFGTSITGSDDDLQYRVCYRWQWLPNGGTEREHYGNPTIEHQSTANITNHRFNYHLSGRSGDFNL
ncbi:MAG: hypothetical protein RIA99_01460, partial [Cytophagales bacterium]